MPVLAPGYNTATVPLSVFPAGLSCGVQVFAASDSAGLHIIAISAINPFSSQGKEQSVPVPITMPAQAGNYYVFKAIYINGILVGIWSDSSITIQLPPQPIQGVPPGGNFIGTVRYYSISASPSAPIVELTLDSPYVSAPTIIHTWAIPIGLPIGNAEMIVWRVPDGTRIKGHLRYGYLDTNPDDGTTVLADPYTLYIDAAEVLSPYDKTTYNFVPSARLNGSNLEWSITESHGKSFAWALMSAWLGGLQSPSPVGVGVGTVSGVVAGYGDINVANKSIYILVNPDPDAVFVDGLRNPFGVNQFYGWQPKINVGGRIISYS